MITLNQLKNAHEFLGVDTAKIDQAIACLAELGEDLEAVEVKGRQNVDTLLGCMMAIDAIIGKEEDNG